MGNAQATTLLDRPDIIACYSVEQSLHVVIVVVVSLVDWLLVACGGGGVDGGIVVQCVSPDVAESQVEEK